MNQIVKYLAVGTLLLFVGCKAGAQQPSTPTVTETKKDTVKIQEEPIGFTTHRVRKRETLYGIAQRYNITEEDIKRYNSELYATQLKKGMRIQIPKYAVREVATDSINPEDFEKYIVQPKETRWSIAHKYGITIDSMISLNPELPKTSNYLAIGQELNLPKIAGSSVDSLQVQLYESYTVPPKMTLYSLSKEYGIKGEQIVRLNPEIAEKGGLKEGMIIRLPKKKDNSGEVNTDNFIFYEVKPKQTEYSLTRNLGISYAQLLALNPELSKGLKAGMILKLPKEKEGELEVKNSLVLDKINLIDSINVANKPKVVFLLPFRLNRVNLNNTEDAKKAIQRSNAINYSLGLYSGAMVALDSIASLGISVEVKTYDTQLDANNTKQILMRENLSNVSAIVGPLELKSLNETAVQAANYQIPVIAPLASRSDLSLNNVFFSIPADSILRKRMLDHLEPKVTDQNLIVIADSLSSVAVQKITEKFPQTRKVEVKEEEKNISINLENFLELLSEDEENWVFVESENTKWVSSVISILNSANTETTTVRMFTTNKNRAFESDVISGVHLSNLKFTYPSAYREVSNNSFVKRYQKRWGSSPDRYAIRGFDLTYDLLLKLAYKANLFESSDLIGVTEYAGNKFNYVKAFSSGYHNNASYIMTYDNMYIKEVKPAP